MKYDERKNDIAHGLIFGIILGAMLMPILTAAIIWMLSKIP